MATVLLIARGLLAVTFALAAAGKLADLAGARASLVQFGVPASLAAPGAVALPLAELAVAVLLAATPTGRIGAATALALLVVFGAAVTAARARGRAPQCHCFGAIHSAPVGPATLVRLAVLAGVSVLVVAAGAGRDLGDALAGIDPWVFVGVAIGVAVLIGQLLFNWQVLRQNGRLLERVRALEEGTAAPRSRTSAPEPGLPVGSPAPDFELVDLEGVPRSLGELLAPGRPLALAFAEPGCAACESLPALLARLQAARDGELDVALISRGSREENEAKLGAERLTTVLLQSEREVALQFGVASVPSAMMIGPDGRVASRLAIGPAKIEALLGATSDAPSQALAGVVR
jgi:methylamine dehydrogenase accessory protein MauD